jgi:uncharacterized protein (TIGR02453 family)
MAFDGWTARALEFYEGLAADNSRAYWTRHKPVYESDVRGPMTELLDELEAEFGPGKIFRPLRDTRYSSDKTAVYKTATCATLDLGGFIQISAAGLAAGNGFQSMAPDQLERYRDSVVDDRAGKELCGVIATAEENGIEISPGQQLKGAPRGYPKEHPRMDLLRRKDLFTWREWPIAPWLATSETKTRIVEFLRASRPLHSWLLAHVGPTTAPRRFGNR